MTDRLDARPLYSERYVIAFPRGHRFEAMDEVPIVELDQEDYLSRVNCEYPDHFDALGVPERCQVNIRYRSEREDWIQSMILAGMGSSFMPEYLPMHSNLPTRLIADPPLTRQIDLVTVSGRRFSPAIQAFVGMVETHDWTA